MPKPSPLTEIEKEKAKVLHAGGKTVHAVARSLARSPGAIKKFLNKPEVRQQVGVQREELAAMFDSVAHRSLAGVTSSDIEKANLVQKLTSAGIAVDKAAMLRGELPPTIHINMLVDVLELLRLRREEEDEHRLLEHSKAHALPPPE
jgi:hypothetical protein